MATVIHPGFFPFCVSEGTLGGSVIKTDLAGAMDLYWKVRTTTFVASPSDGPSSSFTFFRSFNYTSEIPNEKHLVCNPGYGLADDKGYNVAEFSVLWEGLKVDGNDYYVPLYFNFFANDNSGRFGSQGLYQNSDSIVIYGFTVPASSQSYQGEISLSVTQTGTTDWTYQP